MTLENETTSVDDAQESADFDAGFAGTKAEKPSGTEKTPEPAQKPREEAAPAPEYVQITKADWDEMRAAASKTASYDQQFSKAFGTLGNLQKVINALQAQAPRGGKIEISKEAFAEMEKDFPELAQQTRSALERALSGVTGTGTAEVDTTKIEQMLAERTSAREVEALEDAHPDWREIVGAVDITKQQPDQNNPFRKWLGTKDAKYQARVNGTESAAVISRAISLFQSETKPQATQVAPRANPRADRIREAVQPRGDGAAAPAAKTDDDEFIAGFNSR